MTNSILLVEDDEDDVFFMRRAMEHSGLQAALRVVDNGKEAINYFRGKGRFDNRELFPLPGLVLLDLMMPLVNGFEVLQWIRDQPNLPVPVVITTASSDTADMERAYDLGANSYYVKTFESGYLRNMVKGATQFWLGRNRPPFPPGVPTARRPNGPTGIPAVGNDRQSQ